MQSGIAGCLHQPDMVPTRLVTVEEYLAVPRRRLSWQIHGLIPRPSKINLIGAPKEGKTFLAFGAAACVASGRDFLGHKTEPGKVLYLQFDTGLATWDEMQRKLVESGVNFPPGLLQIHPEDIKRPLNVLLSDSRAYLKGIVKGSDPDLVVLDTLRKVHSADENDSTEMKVVGDALDEVFGDVALLLLHHARKIPAEVLEPDPAQSGRGSSAIMADADGLWLLHRNTLRTTSRFDERGVYRLDREDNGMWAAGDAGARADLVVKVLAICTEYPATPHTHLAAIAKARLGISRASFYRCLAGRACAHRPAGTQAV